MSSLGRMVNGAIGIILFASSVGCSGNTWQISCGQLRSLRVGMSYADVETILGPPASRSSEDMRDRQVYKDVDTVWAYHTDGVVDELRAVRLAAEFSKGKLVTAYSYRREDRPNEVFRLDDDGVFEGKEFRRWFCPSGIG